jgi:hypothetical protein
VRGGDLAVISSIGHGVTTGVTRTQFWATFGLVARCEWSEISWELGGPFVSIGDFSLAKEAKPPDGAGLPTPTIRLVGCRGLNLTSGDFCVERPRPTGLGLKGARRLTKRQRRVSFLNRTGVHRWLSQERSEQLTVRARLMA